MGCAPSKTVSTKAKKDSERSQISISDFVLSELIGIGGSAKVYKAKRKATKRSYAIKVVNKARAKEMKLEKLIFIEKRILTSIYSETVVNLQFCFEDECNFYFGVDYKGGGDFRLFLNKKYKKTEAELQFVAANALIALDFLSSKGIVHRDIKPENLLFDKKGYIFLTDFGISKEIGVDPCDDDFGTPCYMAPESILEGKWDCRSDFYSLGMILFEMISGKAFFKGLSKSAVKSQMSKGIYVDLKGPEGVWSENAISFVKSLIEAKPSKRLASFKKARMHPFFAKFDWKGIKEKTMESPCETTNTTDKSYLKKIQSIYLEIAKESSIPSKSTNQFEFQRRNILSLPSTVVRSTVSIV